MVTFVGICRTYIGFCRNRGKNQASFLWKIWKMMKMCSRELIMIDHGHSWWLIFLSLKVVTQDLIHIQLQVEPCIRGASHPTSGHWAFWIEKKKHLDIYHIINATPIMCTTSGSYPGLSCNSWIPPWLRCASHRSSPTGQGVALRSGGGAEMSWVCEQRTTALHVIPSHLYLFLFILDTFILGSKHVTPA